MNELTTHDGLRLRVRVEGPDDAPLTVLLSHCWTSDLESWHYQARALRHELGHDVRLLRHDHRGHGRSEATPRHAATIENLARDLADVLHEYAPQGPLLLAGHSIGGMTLMELAAQRPQVFDRVVGVVLVSTSSGGLDRVTLGIPEKLASGCGTGSR